jgi:hypothetical protein
LLSKSVPEKVIPTGPLDMGVVELPVGVRPGVGVIVVGTGVVGGGVEVDVEDPDVK